MAGILACSELRTQRTLGKHLDSNWTGFSLEHERLLKTHTMHRCDTRTLPRAAMEGAHAGRVCVPPGHGRADPPLLPFLRLRPHVCACSLNVCMGELHRDAPQSLQPHLVLVSAPAVAPCSMKSSADAL